MKNKYDYTGKTIFVGIDVHKKTYSVSVVSDGVLVKRDTMSADRKRLVSYLKKYFSEATIKSAYEAGFSGFGLHRYLIDNGIENVSRQLSWHDDDNYDGRLGPLFKR